MNNKAKYIYGIILALVFALLVIGVYESINNNIEANFLLTVVATVGALGGIAFALYGWYSSREIPKLVESKVDEKIEEIKEEFQMQIHEQQEVMQKMNAVYQIEDPDKKIELLEDILEIDPDTYNANITLAYTYWYEKNNIDKAEDYLLDELKNHKDNYQAACDLVALYTDIEDYRRALKFLKKALNINNNSWKYIENDSRLEKLRKNKKDEYKKIIDKYKN
ncbi:MAG: tetratricopeptide repeat protein [Halanaerobiales bacterium]